MCVLKDTNKRSKKSKTPEEVEPNKHNKRHRGIGKVSTTHRG